jgi:DNA-binding NtrC family response regulator
MPPTRLAGAADGDAEGNRQPAVPDTLLIVDDDPRVLTALSEALTSESVTVRIAPSADAALELFAAQPPDVALADVRMPGRSGLEFLRLVRERSPRTDVLLMTAYEDLPTVAAAMRDGAVDFLIKPLDLFRLRETLSRVFADRAARRDRGNPPAAAPTPDAGLVGRDPAMIDVFKTIGQAAAANTTVLIRGESGTGKEMIARAIHALSARTGRPFVAVNCTAIPETLLESELFGHVRGAFTGATGDRAGRFAQARDGTILLDEIGDTSGEFQAKLLRILQEGEYYPVGADRPQRTAARVIAATHQDLEELVERREFRADLYYRLRVLEITVPPLRARRGDIPLLVDHLLARKTCAAKRLPAVVDAAAMAVLTAHDWPGNVRELENCLERALVAAPGEVIRAEHLKLARPREDEAAAGATSLEEAERAHITRILQTTGGHKSRSAALLQISRPRLDRLIEKYALEAFVKARRNPADEEAGE